MLQPVLPGSLGQVLKLFSLSGMGIVDEDIYFTWVPAKKRRRTWERSPNDWYRPDPNRKKEVIPLDG